MKILLTGFEPFGGAEVNPSWEAVSALPDVVGSYALSKVLVPVVFGEAGDVASRAFAEVSPSVVLMVGMAAGRDSITPEYVAINLRHTDMPDNSGVTYRNSCVVEDGADAYFTGLPVFDLAENLVARGIPARVSFSAGTYVCNDLFYTMCHKYGNKAKIGFVHVPSEMPLETITEALRIIIETL